MAEKDFVTKSFEQAASKLDAKDKKFLLFSLLCLQIAYPAVYSLLVNKPDFTTWNDEFAFNETKRSEERNN